MSAKRINVRLLTAALFVLALTSAARAQAVRTWVSGTGDDLNVCSRTAPCKTFAGAISKTATDGEIDILDPAGYGNLTVSKSITIDGYGSLAGIIPATNGVSVSFDNFLAGDTRKSVQLRNLVINGTNSGGRGIRITGGATVAGGFVSVEHCVIEGVTGAPGRGIEDSRTGGGKLLVNDTTFQNLSGSAVAQDIVGTTRVDWTINNVRVFNCLYGIAAGSGSRVLVTNSVISGCTNAGLYVESPSGTAEMQVENTVSTNNGTGVQATTGGTIRLSNSTITFNATAASGTVLTYGDNKVAGNTSAGSALTAVGAASSNYGQQ